MFYALGTTDRSAAEFKYFQFLLYLKNPASESRSGIDEVPSRIELLYTVLQTVA